MNESKIIKNLNKHSKLLNDVDFNSFSRLNEFQNALPCDYTVFKAFEEAFEITFNKTDKRILEFVSSLDPFYQLKKIFTDPDIINSIVEFCKFQNNLSLNSKYLANFAEISGLSFNYLTFPQLEYIQGFSMQAEFIKRMDFTAYTNLIEVSNYSNEIVESFNLFSNLPLNDIADMGRTFYTTVSNTPDLEDLSLANSSWEDPEVEEVINIWGVYCEKIKTSYREANNYYSNLTSKHAILLYVLSFIFGSYLNSKDIAPYQVPRYILEFIQAKLEPTKEQVHLKNETFDYQIPEELKTLELNFQEKK